MIIHLEEEDKRLDFPGFYNIYPIRNEVSQFGSLGIQGNHLTTPIIDEYYGRVFSEEVVRYGIPYGKTSHMPYYPCGYSGNVVGEMRVPYRRVPVFSVKDYSELSMIFLAIREYSPQHKILVRGQTRTHELGRDEDEKGLLYGSNDHIEPSFLPSGMRKGFSDLFLSCLWESQTRILLHDLSIDLREQLSQSNFAEFSESVDRLLQSPRIVPFGLGIAQHYGLPSIGLDLTDDLKVALWFASNEILVSPEGHASYEPAAGLSNGRLFFFRCPTNSVYSHTDLKPGFFPASRPDFQKAWFGHVGWGLSKNQMASYLCCAVEIHEGLLSAIPNDYAQVLFPAVESDPILGHFWKVKRLAKYEREARRALQTVYKFGKA